MSAPACVVCGGLDKMAYPYSDPGTCFLCSFWLQHSRWDRVENAGRALVVNGHHYLIGEPGAFGSERGFYGAEFIFEWVAGGRGSSTNMWYQGEVPARFRHLFPDNARFIVRMGRQVDTSLPVVRSDDQAEKDRT